MCFSPRRFVLVLLAIALLTTLSTAQVLETGSLREFLLGNEENAAYDNWLSRTVEGLAVPGGYNVHMPPEYDPQTNGFGEFVFIPDDEAADARDAWREIFAAVINDLPEDAETVIEDNQFPYELVYFDDTETGETYRILRETLDSTYVDTGYFAGEEDDVVGGFSHGWGIYIFNPNAIHLGVNIQVCHVNDDYIAVPVAVTLFLDGSLGALGLHGCGREVYSVEGEDYNNSRSLSDPSRNGNLPFHWYTEFFVESARAEGLTDLTIQFHSYDTESHQGEPTIQVSCGITDGYANRPSRDISWEGHDWVNFTPSVAVPQDYSMPGQASVAVQNLYAIVRGWGLVHLESGAEIPTNAQLWGYPDSPQMATVFEGLNRYESFDRWLHVELDELPQAIEDAGHTESDFFAGTSPPTLVNWEPMLRYYESSINALIAYLDDIVNFEDIEAPSGPSSPYIFYTGDDFVELAWNNRAFDPNFATYEVYYGTTPVIDLDSDVWTFENDPNLVGQNIQFTQITGLDFNQDYGFRIRGVDFDGNAGELTTLTARGITVEGNLNPESFGLVGPTLGDTCRTLDTTLTWYSTADADLYDTPFYDVWLDTLADLSTAWLIEEADSIADTTYFVEKLLNHKTYYWTVRATDRNTGGTWADDTLSFVTHHPDPPYPFSLLTPMDRSTLWGDTETTLSWESTSDPDEQADITFKLWWSTIPDFTGADSLVTTDTSYVLTGLEIDSTYWWMVVAYDDMDSTICDDVWRFYVEDAVDPVPFALAEPDDEMRMLQDTVGVTWTRPGGPVPLAINDGEETNPFEDVLRQEMFNRYSTWSNLTKGSTEGIGQGFSELDDNGGPDGAGHLWIDNNEPGGPLFDWQDITLTGIHSIVSGMDDGTATVVLPFTFNYFGQDYSSVNICSNGNIHFGGADAEWNNSPIPDGDGPSAMISPWWTDLRPNVQGDIYYYGDDEQFVVLWDNIREYGHEDWLYTFQVILYPNGKIKFQYLELQGDTANGTVGIENQDENDGLMMAFNAEYIEERLAVLFTFEDYVYDIQWSLDPGFTQYNSGGTSDTTYTITDVDVAQFMHWNNYFNEMDELPDDVTVYWRVYFEDFYSRVNWADPGESGWSFDIYLPDEPLPFDLAYPQNQDTVYVDTVTVQWYHSIDPDADDELEYIIEWADNEDFIFSNTSTTQDTFLVITDLEQTQTQAAGNGRKKLSPVSGISKVKTKSSSQKKTASGKGSLTEKNPVPIANELDELLDERFYYWRVYVVDSFGNETWSNPGEDGWSFYVEVPEPPSEFALLTPVNHDTLSTEECYDLAFTWEESEDPDPEETVSYELFINVIVTPGNDSLLIYRNLDDTELSLHLLDSLGVTYWEEYLSGTWWVNAVSNNDTVECEEQFQFYVEPNSSVFENRFSGIPDKYEIAAAFPNPFNPSLTAVIALPHQSDLKVNIFNILGKEVAVLASGRFNAGYKRFVFDGKDLASGIYFIHANVPGNLQEVRKVVLIK